MDEQVNSQPESQPVAPIQTPVQPAVSPQAQVSAGIQNVASKMGKISQASGLSTEDKVFAALSYVSVLFIVPLILKHEDLLVRFHAKQGLALFGAEVVVWFLLFLLNSFFSVLAPGNTLGIVPALSSLAWIFFVIVSLVAIALIFRDKKWEIPVLARFAAKIDI